MKKTQHTTKTKVQTQQASTPAPTPPYEAIYLGADLHKDTICVTRIIDGSTPQPAQRMSWEAFWHFVEKQQTLAQQVYVNYEAGAFGFWPYRKLEELGVHCYVVHPEKLDPQHKGVQTDGLDSGQLADRLYRYVQGNEKAMTVVYVPTEEEEAARLESRHRRHLHDQLHQLISRGMGLLLSQGVFETQGWWKLPRWEELKPQLSASLQGVLDELGELARDWQQRLGQVDKQLEATAPKSLPVGFGALTYVLLLRELCNYQRFETRRGVGGFTGLCGGVSQSSHYHLDLSITKTGNPYVRKLLIELAWRMIYYQPQYTGLTVWQRYCGAGKAVHKRRRKSAVVAVARQLAVDIWRWQTGQVSPEELGWKMTK